MKHLLAFLLLLLPFTVLADQDKPRPLPSCGKQVPYGMPESNKELAIICRTAYLVGNDTDAKIPAWVAYQLTPKNALGCDVRSDKFASDKSLPKDQRSEPRDYARSGYDIGHMAPVGDMSWSDITQHESFILSNTSPQLPGLNRGIWKLLESAVRSWSVDQNRTLIIYVGPIYNMRGKTIGDNNVRVPEAFYKIIIDKNTKETVAFILPHREGLGNNIAKFQTTIAEVQNQTGIKFKFPKGVDLNDKPEHWEYSIKNLNNSKKAACKLY